MRLARSLDVVAGLAGISKAVSVGVGTGPAWV